LRLGKGKAFSLQTVLHFPFPLSIPKIHFGRSGPPDITDTYSLLVLNITFRTTADDLFPLFDKYGKVVNIFIPKDRRTSDSCGFAFVCYKYDDKAQKAVDRLDGRVVDGREITVQFAKYGPNAERIQKERIIESFPRSRSRSPRRRFDFLEGTPILPLFTGTTIKKIGIIEEEVEVEVITDMNVIDIVGKTETLGAKAGAIVLVLFVLKAGEEIVMMKIGEVAVDQGVFLLIATVLVLRRVLPHVRHLPLGVKVLIDGAVMGILQVLEVFHHEAVVLILGACLLETQIDE
ncbi:uncharacterized protein LOC120154902, partial [Hibiscus syriacus]|uniref:uncharacterized protein LOC120154902 n=1 Tax=Hibiscus syriacus TaxID=106335 RepID=UPI0019250FE4